MKKYLSGLFAFALLISLTACGQSTPAEGTVICTAEPVQNVEATENSGVYTVSTPDEFIKAIGPDREIHLTEGEISLSKASSYSGSTESPYCFWSETYDGYELVIHDVDNLTIVGAGMDATTISVAPRYAQVLKFQNCSNISLNKLTAGHTIAPGSCIGGVLYFYDCKDISIEDTGLFGCGITGVTTESCENLTLTDSDIYECSYNGVDLTDTKSVNIEDCEFYDLGKKEEWEAGEIFALSGCTDISITDCEIYDNKSQYLLRNSGTDQVVLKNNEFRNNWVTIAAFDVSGNYVTLEDNTFEECLIYEWFTGDSGAVDTQGNPITEESMLGVVPEETIPDGPMTTVTVTNADEFLAAIAPNTEIVIDAGKIDLSTAAEYGGDPKQYYRWEDIYDGPGLIITNVKNLTIRSKDGQMKAHTICAVPRYANVLTFANCENLNLSGFTAGHTEGPGECTGGVLKFINSKTINVDNCGMFGCGTLGVEAENCTDIFLYKCDIYECSDGGVMMMDTTGVDIEDCTFRDLGGNNLMFYGCDDVIADGDTIDGSNYNGR